MRGIVKWFDAAKGFGFIVANNKDHFVYFKQIKSSGFKTLLEGACVDFEPAMGVKGMEAHNVRVIDDRD
jgi:CspA family cold shock protein